MTETFHDGELDVQRRAGSADMARKVGGGIGEAIPAAAAHFLAERRMLFAGAADARRRWWATAFTGDPGFAQVRDERTLDLRASLRGDDPLRAELRSGSAIGLLAIDFATRRRMRLNGSVVESGDNLLRVRSEQVYGNCPKYIQRRVLESDAGARAGAAAESRRGTSLTPAQQAWIAAADTFFIATAHPESGADVSHRGGNPGFLRVLDRHTLLWPDYAGNRMYQTLGNLSVQPDAGLLFLDFDSGAALHLSGEAAVLWGDARTAEFAGAERLLRFTVAEVVERPSVISPGWRLLERSPHNPA